LKLEKVDKENMSGYGITDDDLIGIYDFIVSSGMEGVSREDFIELIRPLKRSVQALLKMMECNGFLLYEECTGEIDFRIYAFTDEMLDNFDDLELSKVLNDRRQEQDKGYSGIRQYEGKLKYNIKKKEGI
jgi:hypothetical protein